MRSSFMLLHHTSLFFPIFYGVFFLTLFYLISSSQDVEPVHPLRCAWETQSAGQPHPIALKCNTSLQAYELFSSCISWCILKLHNTFSNVCACKERTQTNYYVKLEIALQLTYLLLVLCCWFFITFHYLHYKVCVCVLFFSTFNLKKHNCTFIVTLCY